MESNCKTRTQVSHLWVAVIFVALLSVALPTNGQSTAAPNPPRPTTPVVPSTSPPTPAAGDNDTTRQELANMDRFLDSHPEIAEQLRKDPSLINNTTFIQDHPELQEFLQSHPGVREEARENPSAFMHAEERYDWREDRRGDGDTTWRELASMDRFLDNHPEVAEQLRKDPSLINNQEFLENHPALQEYLQSHPEVREEIRENPSAFMQEENRYERHEDRDRPRDWDRDGDRREIGGFGDFLRGHATMADALSRDPSLANNKEFLESHPELRVYLQAHPGIQQRLAADPRAVMTSPALAGTLTSPAGKGLSNPAMKHEDNMKPEQQP